jgi:tyrosine-protein kinase Etk/Wzc
MDSFLDDIEQKDKNSFNVQKYLFQLLKNWYYIVGALLIGIGIAFLMNRYTTPVYQASASVIIDDQENVQNMFERMYTPWTKQRSLVQNEQTVLQSYSLARRSLERLGLDVQYYGIGRLRNSQIYPYIGFDVKLKEGNANHSKLYIDILTDNTYRLYDEETATIDTIMEFGRAFKSNGFHFTVFLQSASIIGKKFSFKITDYNSLANQYKSMLSISLYNEYGSVLMLRLRGSNKNLVVDYLNTISEEYIDYSLEKKVEITKNTLEFIQEQKGRIVDSLNNIEQQLFQLKFGSPEFNISEKGELQLDVLDELNKQKLDLGKAASKQDKFLDLMEKLGIYDKLVVLSMMEGLNPMLSEDISALKDLVQEKEALQKMAKKEIPGANWNDDKIELQEERIRNNISTVIGYNEWLEQQIDSVLKVFQANLLQMSTEKHQGLNVQRKYEVFRTFYNILLEKEAQISIQQSSISSNKSILDLARTENAVLLAPKKQNNYQKMVISSLALSIGLILLINFLNPKIMDKEDIVNKTKVPMLGLIGHNSSKYEIPVVEKPHSAMAEAFRRIRTNLQFVVRGTENKVIMVTSTISGEGKTFTSINIAAVMALTDKKILLMGMDLRKPNIHKILNLSNDLGISNYLAGKKAYKDILIPTNIKNLTAAVSGPIPPNPSELIESDGFARLIDQARKDFDYIVIDTPPVALVTDALLIANHCDATIFVIRQNYTDKRVLDMINEFYYDKKLKNLNLLVNDVKVAQTMGYRYSYGYSYGYGYGYGKYNAPDSRYVEDSDDVMGRKKGRRL